MKKTMNFYDWCLTNQRSDLLNRWNYELNECNPCDVSYASSNKFYFNCDRHVDHGPTLVRLASLTSAGQNIKCAECNSFAQWVLDKYDQDYLDKIWNVELNTNSPWDVSAKSHCDIYLNCIDVDYHKGYKTTAARFTGGQKVCGFCHGLQVHPLDSFATCNIKKYGDDFLDKYWDYDKNTVDPYNITSNSGQKVYLKCESILYHGSYIVRANDFSAGKSKCPYCRGLKVHSLDSVGVKYPIIFDFWSNKNKLTPCDYTIHSGKKVWLTCHNQIHQDYQKSLRDAVGAGFHCPQCSNLRKESYLEEAVRTYIADIYLYPIMHEFACSIAAINPNTGCKLPYDNEVILPNGNHLIIEVHGRQHFMITHLTMLSAKHYNVPAGDILKQQQERDQVKRDYIDSLPNYFLLEIPYTAYADESYKTLIDNKIKQILPT